MLISFDFRSIMNLADMITVRRVATRHTYLILTVLIIQAIMLPHTLIYCAIYLVSSKRELRHSSPTFARLPAYVPFTVYSNSVLAV